MRCFRSSRLIAPLVALILALGLVAFGVSTAAMDAGMSPVAADMPADCGVCDQDTMPMTAAACFVMCNGMQIGVAEPGAPSDSRLGSAARPPEARATGSIDAPDPFPPKLIVLG